MKKAKLHRKGEMKIKMMIAPGTPLKDALCSIEEGRYVWVNEDGQPEQLIPLITKDKIDAIFRNYPDMVNKTVKFAQSVAPNDIALFIK